MYFNTKQISDKLANIPKIFFLFLIFFILFEFFQSIYQILNWPYSLNSVEGNMIFFMWELRGGALYNNIKTADFVINTYAPLYYFVAFLFTKIFFIFNDLVSLRLLTFLLEIYCGILIFLLLKKENRNLFSSILLSINYLGLMYLHKFHGLVRLDMLLVALLLTSVYFLRSYELSRKSRFLYLYAIFMVLAFLTKISSIFTLLTLLVYLLYKKEKLALIFSSFSLVLSLLLYLVVNLYTDNQFFIQTIYFQYLSHLQFYLAFYYILDFLVRFWFFILFGIFALFVKNIPLVYKFLFAGSLFEFLLTLTKGGGDLNYSLLLLTFGVITLFFLFYSMPRLNMLFQLILFLSLVVQKSYYHTYLNDRAVIADTEYVQNLMRSSRSKYMFTTDVMYALQLNKKLVTNDPYQFGTLLYTGGFSVEELQSSLDKHEVDYIFNNNLAKHFYDFERLGYKLVYNSSTDIPNGWEVWYRDAAVFLPEIED